MYLENPQMKELEDTVDGYCCCVVVISVGHARGLLR